MDDLERKLRELALRRPSEALDERVVGAGREAAEPESPPRVERRVPLWMALAASILMILLGFAGGTLWSAKKAPQVAQARPSVVNMYVTYTSSAPNPFDCTRVSQDFLPGPVDMKVQVEGGV